jgi:hypothetical protein
VFISSRCEIIRSRTPAARVLGHIEDAAPR